MNIFEKSKLHANRRKMVTILWRIKLIPNIIYSAHNISEILLVLGMNYFM